MGIPPLCQEPKPQVYRKCTQTRPRCYQVKSLASNHTRCIVNLNSKSKEQCAQTVFKYIIQSTFTTLYFRKLAASLKIKRDPLQIKSKSNPMAFKGSIFLLMYSEWTRVNPPIFSLILKMDNKKEQTTIKCYRQSLTIIHRTYPFPVSNTSQVVDLYFPPFCTFRAIALYPRRSPVIDGRDCLQNWIDKKSSLFTGLIEIL